MRSVDWAPPCVSPTTAEVALPTRLAAQDDATAGRGLIGVAADYLELTKPRISLLVLVTVTVGFLLGSAGAWQTAALLVALIGIGLVAAGCSAFNQLLERSTDARMHRTADRPLPAGRLRPREVLVFAVTTTVGGLLSLTIWVNPLTAVLAAVTLVIYSAVYTPLKRVTPLCTAIGAVPGALPPVLGWTAASGRLDVGAGVLFAIMFLWQFPHFLAIAWLYRADYARADLRMLPTLTPHPSPSGRGAGGEGLCSRVTALMSVAYVLVLLPISLWPRELALAGDAYFLVALLLGTGYLAAALRFVYRQTRGTARGLLWTSLVYLPGLLLILTWDHFQLLQW